jgi:hypothetical protein
MSQFNKGGNVSMSFFVKPESEPRRLTEGEQLIKGLNRETIISVPLPRPQWLQDSNYTTLFTSKQTGPDFSLNWPSYRSSLDDVEWSERWFHVHGLVHPYALTWQVEAYGEEQEYTIPAVIVRDGGIEP